MLTDILKTYKLSSGFNRTGFYASVEACLAWSLAQAGGPIELFTEEAREEMALLCRMPLQVQQIA